MCRTVKTSQCEADVPQCEMMSRQSGLRFPILFYLSNRHFHNVARSDFFFLSSPHVWMCHMFIAPETDLCEIKTHTKKDAVLL